MVPDYEEWCQEAADGRMSADEVLARLQSALPENSDIRPRVRTRVFSSLFVLDPRAAVAWLGSEGPEAQAALQGIMVRSHEVPVELRGEIAATLLGEEMESSGIWNLSQDYDDWYRDDPEACRQAVEALPEGPLKENLLGIVRKEGNQ